MFETIKRLYAKTGDTALVAKAVYRGWITAEQYEAITGSALLLNEDELSAGKDDYLAALERLGVEV